MREVAPSSESIRNRSHFIYAAVGLAILVVVGICVFGVFSSKRSEDAAAKDFSGYSMSSLLGEAESGNVAAQVRVSEHYRDGTGGFAKSDTNHFEWALRAANAGNIRAKVYVGICYFHGTGTTKELERAYEMLAGPAMDFNHPTAQAYMGFYCTGDYGRPRQDELALEWFRKSAAQGDPFGEFSYGQRLLLGNNGASKDAKEGVRLLRLSLEHGNVRAAGPLGWAHANGEGVEKDYKEAARLYEKDASQGGARAAHALALLYLDGNGVIKDVEVALKWLKKSSEGGYMEAKKSLGRMYDYGIMVAIDRVTASKYYMEVALSGDVDCQRVMGARFSQGLGLSGDANPGLSNDLNEAYAWYNVAASNGDSQASASREEIAKSLNAEQILAAQKRSREILKEIEAKKAKK